MYYKVARVKKLDYFTKLDKSFHSDLHWWHVFINAWNGCSFLHVINHHQLPYLHRCLRVVAALVRNGSSMHGQLSDQTSTSWPRNYFQLSLVMPSGAHNYPRRQSRFIVITWVQSQQSTRALRRTKLECTCFTAYGSFSNQNYCQSYTRS